MADPDTHLFSLVKAQEQLQCMDSFLNAWDDYWAVLSAHVNDWFKTKKIQVKMPKTKRPRSPNLSVAIKRLETKALPLQQQDLLPDLKGAVPFRVTGDLYHWLDSLWRKGGSKRPTRWRREVVRRLTGPAAENRDRLRLLRKRIATSLAKESRRSRKAPSQHIREATKPPLSPKERLVLERIPFWPLAITGPELLSKLAKEGTLLEQSTLTRHMIPKLKDHYKVKNRPNVGYYRTRS